MDLPQPVGPTTATNSPGATVKSMFFTAVWMPPSVPGKRFVAPRSSMSGLLIAAPVSGAALV
ncbi:hypothetical protein [Nocardia sp. NPDC055049]